LPQKKKISPKTVKMIDKALEAIIDQWYLSVSDYYVTLEKRTETPEIEGPEELKRFHDDGSHRIKFNKGDLDFTYGLAVESDASGCRLEASVNNKVPNFNYGELVRRLSSHYEIAKAQPVQGFRKLKKVRCCDVFSLPEDLHNNVAVEHRDGKADIVRLSFDVIEDHLEDLVAEPAGFMDLIHQYCVAPLRRIYADVYRTRK
jgi:hypothetical protein